MKNALHFILTPEKTGDAPQDRTHERRGKSY